MITPKLEARFWAKVNCPANDQCWLWQANATKAGYGRFQAAGKTFAATHVALTLAGYPRIGKYQALHSCDNPRCVNPQHLRWGTHKDNMHDKVARGRAGRPRGAASPCSQPDTDENRRIKAYIVYSSKSQRALGAELGKPYSMIFDIRKGRKWGSVTLIPFASGAHMGGNDAD